MAKTALITGASSGLGAEYARQFATRGIGLVLVARDRDALTELATELAGRVDVEVLAADLLNDRQRRKVERRLEDHDRPIDILVNNAGYGLPLAFERNDIEDEVRHLHLHVEVPMRLSHVALQSMLSRGEGRILNVASVGAFMPRSTYGACKRWLIDFSRWANTVYADRGVTVTAVCPGFTHTSFHERAGLPPGEEGVPDWLWLDARNVVAESIVDAARGKAVSIPSLRYKVLARLIRILPDAASTPLGRRGR